MKNLKKILISGAGGFLGNELVQHFLETGDAEVYALTSQNERVKQKFSKYNQFHLGDKGIKSVDIFINCAFPRNTDGMGIANGLGYITDLMESMNNSGCKAAINISSQSVYSPKRMEPADEADTINPETKYAVGKYASELLFNSIFSGIPHSNLRMASLVGKGFSQRITNKFVEMALRGEHLHIVDAVQRFGFLDVRDAADAIVKMAFSEPEKWEEIYNLGTNDSYLLREIAEMVVAVSEKNYGKRVEIEIEGIAECKNSSLNCKKFQEQFRWKPQYNLYDSILELFDAELYKKSGNEGDL